MLPSRLPRALIAALLLGAGAFLAALGAPFPLLVAAAWMLLANLLVPRSPGGATSAWLSCAGALTLFLSGSPLVGAPPDAVLLTAVMGIYFICWVQLLKREPLGGLPPAAPFSLAFYASLLWVFLILRSRLVNLPPSLETLLASIIVLLSLGLWECARQSRLTQAAQIEETSLPDWLGRLLVLTAILLFTFLLFRLPLPWMAQGAVNLAANLGLTASDVIPGESNLSWNTPQSPDTQQNPASDQNADGSASGRSEHPPDWTQGELPPEVDLRLSDEVHLHVEILPESPGHTPDDRPLYVRTRSLSFFHQRRWQDSPAAPAAPPRGGFLLDAADSVLDGWVTWKTAPPQDHILHRVFLYHKKADQPVPAIPNPIAFEGGSVSRRTDDLIIADGIGNVAYTLLSAPLFFEDLPNAQALQPGAADLPYRETADGVTFRDIDAALLSPIRENEPSLHGRLQALRERFATEYSYSHTVENEDDRDPLDNFLFHEKKGTCDFFAQVGAHLARRLDVPSRVTYGYAGGLFDPEHQTYTFREKDAHAWTEILLDPHGWVIYDLTPPGQGAPTIAERLPAGSPDPLNPFRNFLDSTPEESPADNPASSPPPAEISSDWAQNLENLWVFRYLNLALALIVGVLLLAYAYRRWRQREADPQDGSRPSGKHLDEPPGYFRDFCRLFENLGRRRVPGETLREYVSHLREAHLLENEFDHLVAYHYQVEYENHQRSRTQERRFLREIRTFRKTLRKGGSDASPA